MLKNVENRVLGTWYPKNGENVGARLHKLWEMLKNRFSGTEYPGHTCGMGRRIYESQDSQLISIGWIYSKYTYWTHKFFMFLSIEVYMGK